MYPDKDTTAKTDLKFQPENIEEVKPNNPPAFAQMYLPGTNKTAGITMLDYFANSAMEAMLANPEILSSVTSANELLTESYQDKVAKMAFNYAQAMLKERLNHIK